MKPFASKRTKAYVIQTGARTQKCEQDRLLRKSKDMGEGVDSVIRVEVECCFVLSGRYLAVLHFCKDPSVETESRGLVNVLVSTFRVG